MKRNHIPIVNSVARLRWSTGIGSTVALLTAIARLYAQSPPLSSYRPWHSMDGRQLMRDTRGTVVPAVRIEGDKAYSLADLIDFAEGHNPETRVAWENARAQGAALGIARSELFPTVAAVALAAGKNKVVLADRGHLLEDPYRRVR